eukprot:1190523-Prorocentrum_minimum.AAC.5
MPKNTLQAPLRAPSPALGPPARPLSDPPLTPAGANWQARDFPPDWRLELGNNQSQTRARPEPDQSESPKNVQSATCVSSEARGDLAQTPCAWVTPPARISTVETSSPPIRWL